MLTAGLVLVAERLAQDASTEKAGWKLLSELLARNDLLPEERAAAKCLLGDALRLLASSPESHDAALRGYMEASADGCAQASFQLGCWYEAAHDSWRAAVPNPAVARYYFELGATQGSSACTKALSSFDVGGATAEGVSPKAPMPLLAQLAARFFGRAHHPHAQC
ncbi:MAG: hypothetical protein AB7L71_02475 [Vicinamibacterales bacterium]